MKTADINIDVVPINDARNLDLQAVGGWSAVPYNSPVAIAISSGQAFVVVQNEGITALDITDPTKPVKIGTYPQSGAACLAIAGQYAYLASSTGSLEIVDISNPSHLTRVGACAIGTGDPVYVADLALHQDYVYLVAGGRLHIINASRSSNPIEVGSYGSQVLGVAFAGTYPCVSTAFGLEFLDQNTSTPHRLAFLPLQNSAQSRVKTSDSYAFTSLANAEFGIIDIRDPLHPQLLGRCMCDGSFSDASSVGTTLYITGMSPGPPFFVLEAIDITDPSAPRRIGGCDTPGMGLAIQGGYGFVADRGVKVIDLTRGANLSAHWIYNNVGFGSPAPQRTMVIENSKCYLMGTDGGLDILDLSDLSRPLRVGSYPTSRSTFTAAGKYAYTVGWYEGPWWEPEISHATLEIVDVSVPTSPRQISTYNTQGDIASISVSGDYAYLAKLNTGRNDGGLEIVDITTPAAPHPVSSFKTTGSLQQVLVSGTYAYLADASGEGLVILDIHNRANPQRIGAVADIRQPRALAISGGYAFVADSTPTGPENDGEGLIVVDISDPTRPLRIGTCQVSGSAQEVAIAGQYAYIAARGSGLQVFDISNPYAPKHVGGDNSFDAYTAQIAGGHVFVGAASQQVGRLMVFDLLESRPSAPNITVQPASQSAQYGTTVAMHVTASGSVPLVYQWRKDGVDVLGATDSTLTLQSVTAADSAAYSATVHNPYGSAMSDTAHLAVLADGANGTRPKGITATPISSKQAGASNLVFVTHGWQPVEFNLTGPPAQPWLVSMTNSIALRLAALGKSSDWQIEAYYWLEDAWTKDPNTALANAQRLGEQVGKQLASQGWHQVHLIAHSAGSQLIQSITEQLKLVTDPPIVQETFLDPFTGRFLENRRDYGLGADWADNYFVIDAGTDLGGLLLLNAPGSTSGKLDFAFNVDVGATLDASLPTQFIVGNGTAGSTSPVYLPPSHGSPIDFYLNTISNTAPACAGGFGFPLSLEVGGSEAWVTHDEGQPPFGLCGSVSFSQNSQPVQVGVAFDLHSMPSQTSIVGVKLLGNAAQFNSSGTSQLQVRGVVIPSSPQSSAKVPSWLAVATMVSNQVNFVQFDAAFQDPTNAGALFSAYWNTNALGVIDEAVAGEQLITYRFLLPTAVSNGLYTLSFRLDADNAGSTLLLTNVLTGFVGFHNPITLSASLEGTAPLLQLNAPANFTFLLQSSTDLVTWMPKALLSTTNDITLFLDSRDATLPGRFYVGSPGTELEFAL